MTTRDTAAQEPPGLTTFDALRAEAEPWLAACYVPPAEFSLMAGPTSTLVFGETGSGKTALRLALERAWKQRTGEGSWLLVPWPVNALAGPPQGLRGSALSAFQQAQVFDAVARRLWLELGRRPELWQQAPAWARATLAWFCRRFFQGDLNSYIEALAEEEKDFNPTTMREIASAAEQEILSQDAPPVLVIETLGRGLARLGFRGIRVLVDDVEPWWQMVPDRLAESLHALLSTLDLFQHPRFFYHMFLPNGLGRRLRNASAVVRRRVRCFYLQPDDETLNSIVQARLAASLGRESFELKELGPPETLLPWLRRCGNGSPRGWLEAARPFLARYLSLAERRPLTTDECRQVAWDHPPPLRIDPETDEITVGWRRVEDLGAGHLALLRHLVAHEGQICHRKQLYRIYIEAYPDSKADPDARPTDYANLLDNALDRLREKIEPLPDFPVLLETKKGRGVRLRSAL